MDQWSRQRQEELNYNLDARRELARLESVEAAIGGFQRRLENAAAQCAAVCRFVKIDTISSADCEAVMPTAREHLKSEAYEKLWDHIASEGLEPCIYREKVLPSSAASVQEHYWLAAKMPY